MSELSCKHERLRTATGQRDDGIGPGRGAFLPGVPVARAGNVLPEYPGEAMRERLAGTVTLRFEVQPDGSVGDIRVIKSSGHSILVRAARDAVRRWRFDPLPRSVVVEKDFEFKQ